MIATTTRTDHVFGDADALAVDASTHGHSSRIVARFAALTAGVRA